MSPRAWAAFPRACMGSDASLPSQVIYLSASCAGAYLASQSMGTYGAAQGLNGVTGMVGGFLVRFPPWHAIVCPLLLLPSLPARWAVLWSCRWKKRKVDLRPPPRQMLFGSRLASGCTSGHGLSGMALLSVQSIVAVCAMFGTAIAVGVTYNALGGYANYVA